MGMIVRYESTIYQNAISGYTVAIYRTEDVRNVPVSAVNQDYKAWVTFTAVGTELPTVRNTEFEMEGQWKDNKKFGKQLSVDWFRIILPKSRDGMIGYLSSGVIKGVGPVTAKNIVDRFGTDTFEVFDHDPRRLLEVKGITEVRLNEIVNSYKGSAGIRELLAFLAPYKVTPKKAEKIQEYFGVEAADIIKRQPYRLCEIKGFGFLTVDPIARASSGFSPADSHRIKAAMGYVLKQAEQEGHLYLESADIISKAEKLLNQGFGPGTVARQNIIRAGNEMATVDGTLKADGKAIFLERNQKAEISASYHILRIMNAPISSFNIEKELEEVQAEFGIILAEQQKAAVRMAFRYPFSIITGGPGKGKTTVLRVILRIFEMIESGKDVLACAPTGRARKRLSESTNYPALTIHKALYLAEDDQEDMDQDVDILTEDFIIADEFTMADMRLASILFSRIKGGARVVLVGDVDQLPSVGPGNVFKELIDSGIIPITVLDVFFRQAKGSRIILNADKMNHGQKDLKYGDDFQLCAQPRVCNLV